MGIFRGEKLWAPIVDGRFLPTSPLQGMGERNTGKPLIVGCDHDHFASLMGSGDRFTLRDGEDPFTTWLRPTLGERTEQIASHLAATTPDESPAQRVARALGELFRGGIIDMAEAWAASGNPVWVYLAMPTQHWGVPPRRLAQFVATGEPNGPGDVHWPAYSVSDRRTLVVDASERIEVDPGGVDRAVFGGVGFGA
jgi:carboxylesterase type B